jgi:HSP20 family protein
MTALAPFFTENQVCRDFFEPFKEGSVFSPAVNVKENDSQYVIEAEMPGVKDEEITINYKDNILKLSAKHSEDKKTDNVEYHRVERRYGSFERSFKFPGNLNAENISAKYENGVLIVTAVKSEDSKSKEIPITK